MSEAEGMVLQMRRCRTENVLETRTQREQIQLHKKECGVKGACLDNHTWFYMVLLVVVVVMCSGAFYSVTLGEPAKKLCQVSWDDLADIIVRLTLLPSRLSSTSLHCHILKRERLSRVRIQLQMIRSTE